MEDVITIDEIQIERADSFDSEPLWNSFENLERIKNRIEFIGVLMESGDIDTDTKAEMARRIEGDGELIKQFSCFLSGVLG